jgi:hypothetical protein
MLFRSYRRTALAFTLTELLVAIGLIAVLLALLLPSARKMPRAYYQGKDQFHWMNLLHDDDPSNDEEAVKALSHILLEARFSCRCLILDSLARAGPRARGAVPSLQAMLEREQDRELWEQVRNTLARIEAPQQQPTAPGSPSPPAPQPTAAASAVPEASNRHGDPGTE